MSQPCGEQKALPLASTRVPHVLLWISQLYPTMQTYPTKYRCERTEIQNCLTKPPLYQVPTTYNSSCPTKCSLVTCRSGEGTGLKCLLELGKSVFARCFHCTMCWGWRRWLGVSPDLQCTMEISVGCKDLCSV